MSAPPHNLGNRLRRAARLAAPAAVALAFAAPTPAGAANPALTRYPYLTDSIQSSITVNWATTRAATTGSVAYGPAGACTAFSKAATRTAITVNGVPEYQWKATIPVSPDTRYCYRVRLGTGDLLGSDPSPAFISQVRAGSATPFSFVVFGDWGQAYDGSANRHQANVMAQIARSGARFAVMTGDTAYPNGSQTNYGDLHQTGLDISAVFGPSFWTVPGRSLPVFNVTGNHGFTGGATQVVNWPEANVAAASGGRYAMEMYPSFSGTFAASYPSFWYAFDAGPARFYILTAAWADRNLGSTGSVYANDALAHWQPSSPEYRWLANDLATHPRAVKFAFWHYPLYADTHGARSDTYLQGGPGTLQGLLNRYRVSIAFNGHAHGYERNRPDGGGMVSYVFGNGGAELGPLDSDCSAFNLYAIGADGTHCGAAPAGLTDDHVYGFAKVTVNGRQVTVTPTDGHGRTYDVQTYTFPVGGQPPPPPAKPNPGGPGAGPRRHCGRHRKGTKHADKMRGTRCRDRLVGRGGGDRLWGYGGADRLFGMTGRDRLWGGSGRDRLWGGSGRDALHGGKGRDLLRGGPGKDRIYARDGVRDRVRCGRGRDVARVDRRDRVKGCEKVRRPARSSRGSRGRA